MQLRPFTNEKPRMRAGPPVTVRYVDWRTRQASAAYTANRNPNVKVLDFIQCGGPGWTRTNDLGLIRITLVLDQGIATPNLDSERPISFQTA